MVETAFFLRFKPQLEKIRRDLIISLNEQVKGILEQAGGKLLSDNNLIRAEYNPDTPGFWLEMLLLIENIKRITENASADIYGFSLVLAKGGDKITEQQCHSLICKTEGGFFLNKEAAFTMKPYVNLENMDAVNDNDFYKISDVKIFIATAKTDLSLQDMNEWSQAMKKFKAILITGKPLLGRRDDLYKHASRISSSLKMQDFPPLIVRFGTGTLNAVIDSFAGWIRSNPQMADGSKITDEILSNWDFLYRQRLKHRPSAFIINRAKLFFGMLLEYYKSLALQAEAYPMVVLENIQVAEHDAKEIVIETLCLQKDIFIFGICPEGIETTILGQWKKLFSGLFNISKSELIKTNIKELPKDLLEIGYAFSLMGRYFPPDMFIQLFAQAGKRPALVHHAVSLLYAMKIIDTPLDPRPWQEDFIAIAETGLGKKTKMIKDMVCKCLLVSVMEKKLEPCLRLIDALADMENADKISDELVIRAIKNELNDLDNNYAEKILDKLINDSSFPPERVNIIRHLIKTMPALYFGKKEEVRFAFTGYSVNYQNFPSLYAQMLLNQSLYHFCMGSNNAALETLKKAAMPCQKNGDSCLTQYYRLSALISLSFRRINETIDYINFAMENAEKSGIIEDMGISAYYAAVAQFIYGNLSLSLKLIKKARMYFLEAGSADWADRCRFLEGRLAYEIGSYRDAADIFEGIINKPFGSNHPQKRRLVELWFFRAKIYCQEPPFYMPYSKGQDFNIIYLEALCLEGNFAKAVEVSNILSSQPVTADAFYNIEQPDWNSGFAQCELLYMTWKDIWDRMLCTYNSLASGHLSSDGHEKAIQSMQQIIRSGQSPELDIYDAFFHYVLYQILLASNSSQVDINTTISMAVKRLQSRAGRIDDIDMHHKYLSQPHWNKAIEQAAREYKLV